MNKGVCREGVGQKKEEDRKEGDREKGRGKENKKGWKGKNEGKEEKDMYKEVIHFVSVEKREDKKGERGMGRNKF